MPKCVPTFGNLRITAYLQLPEAYRSLSRPSSAPDAKAFPLRSFQLDLTLNVLQRLVLLNYAGLQQKIVYKIVFTLLELTFRPVPI